MNELTAAQTTANWVQTVIIFFAFVAAIYAALYARDAAKAAERMAFDTPVAIAAAVEANNEMRHANELTKLGRRPWLSLAVHPEATLRVALSEGKPFHHSICIKAVVKNYGQSPALYPQMDVLLFDMRSRFEHNQLEALLRKSVATTGFGGPPIFPGEEVTLGEQTLYYRPPVSPETGEKITTALAAKDLGVMVGLYYSGTGMDELMSITDILISRMPDEMTDDQFDATDKPIILSSLALTTRVS